VSCSWRPAVAGALLLTARLTPTSQSLTASSLATWISIAPRASRR
jgi:hypothetical protein